MVCERCALLERRLVLERARNQQLTEEAHMLDHRIAELEHLPDELAREARFTELRRGW